ncbi:Type II pantothenate kinase [bacterium HR30]|nr:Type II pantothenate kinase [bacterium HR30]
MIIGIDLGGSTTDAVLWGTNPHVVTVEANDPIAAAAGALGKLTEEIGVGLGSIEAVAATGGGSRRLGERILGIPVHKVPEIVAIGIGGATLAERERALVVSLGTGTALVSVERGDVQHVGGTGVGGGTLLGLARHLVQISRLDTLERLAAAGDLAHVDLTVGDIAGGPVGRLPAHATASNFGKLGADARPEDKARGLVNMIAEVIVSLSVLAARACSQQDIVLTGKLLRVRPFMERVRATTGLFDVQFLVPPYAEYATAIGAARHLATSAGEAR